MDPTLCRRHSGDLRAVQLRQAMQKALDTSFSENILFPLHPIVMKQDSMLAVVALAWWKLNRKASESFCYAYRLLPPVVVITYATFFLKTKCLRCCQLYCVFGNRRTQNQETS